MAVRRSGNGAPASKAAPAATARSRPAGPAPAAPAPALPASASPGSTHSKPVPTKSGLNKSRAADRVSADHVSATRSPKQAGRDVVLVTGPTEDGKGLNVLRAKDDTLQMGAVRPLEEGKPIHGEVVKLKQRAELPGLFDVESQFGGDTETASADPSAPARRPTDRADSSARPTSSGPAQVATDTYRSGWDRIYRRSAKSDLPN